jgi:hypothetical protein
VGESDLLDQLAGSSSHGGCPADEELSVLWALARSRDEAARDGLTAAEVATVVTRAGRRSMSRQAALGYLRRLATGPAVHRKRRRNGPDEFSLMAEGDGRLGASRPVVLVDPSRALQEVRELEGILSTLRGAVRICDPYLDSRTLDFIGGMASATSVKLLTERVSDAPKVERELKVVVKQLGAPIEVRVASKGILHDRYILHDGGMLVLGTSLNSFGMKQSFVSKVGHDVTLATGQFFDDKWKAAKPL